MSGVSIPFEARLFSQAERAVLCVFTSPFARDRALAHSLIRQGRSSDICERCPVEVSRQRDPHGICERALRGETPEFTGVSSPSESRQHPKAVARRSRG